MQWSTDVIVAVIGVLAAIIAAVVEWCRDSKDEAIVCCIDMDLATISTLS